MAFFSRKSVQNWRRNRRKSCDPLMWRQVSFSLVAVNHMLSARCIKPYLMRVCWLVAVPLMYRGVSIVPLHNSVITLYHPYRITETYRLGGTKEIISFGHADQFTCPTRIDKMSCCRFLFTFLYLWALVLKPCVTELRISWPLLAISRLALAVLWRDIIALKVFRCHIFSN